MLLDGNEEPEKDYCDDNAIISIASWIDEDINKDIYLCDNYITDGSNGNGDSFYENIKKEYGLILIDDLVITEEDYIINHFYESVSSTPFYSIKEQSIDTYDSNISITESGTTITKQFDEFIEEEIFISILIFCQIIIIYFHHQIFKIKVFRLMLNI